MAEGINRIWKFLPKSDRTPKPARPLDGSSPCDVDIKPLPARTREMPEYAEGAAAFTAGKTDDSNPYECGGFTGGQRISWFTGFYDAQTNAKLGNAFERNGISFP